MTQQKISKPLSKLFYSSKLKLKIRKQPSNPRIQDIFIQHLKKMEGQDKNSQTLEKDEESYRTKTLILKKKFRKTEQDDKENWTSQNKDIIKPSEDRNKQANLKKVQREKGKAKIKIMKSLKKFSILRQKSESKEIRTSSNHDEKIQIGPLRGFSQKQMTNNQIRLQRLQIADNFTELMQKEKRRIKIRGFKAPMLQIIDHFQCKKKVRQSYCFRNERIKKSITQADSPIPAFHNQRIQNLYKFRDS